MTFNSPKHIEPNKYYDLFPNLLVKFRGSHYQYVFTTHTIYIEI
jgi:hypothetical protein